jgi:hypothetical protein
MGFARSITGKVNKNNGRPDGFRRLSSWSVTTRKKLSGDNMKKLISLLSLMALVALSVPAFAQDTDPTTPPAVDCNTLKGKEKADCKKAQKDKKNKK